MMSYPAKRTATTKLENWLLIGPVKTSGLCEHIVYLLTVYGGNSDVSVELTEWFVCNIMF